MPILWDGSSGCFPPRTLPILPRRSPIPLRLPVACEFSPSTTPAFAEIEWPSRPQHAKHAISCLLPAQSGELPDPANPTTGPRAGLVLSFSGTAPVRQGTESALRAPFASTSRSHLQFVSEVLVRFRVAVWGPR